MAKIDLHIHSSFSDDGEFSPEELLRLGKQAHLDYMAITDHNTVEGVFPALTLAEQFDIQVVSGIELDCVHQGRNFHLLGYGFDYTKSEFAQIKHDIMIQEKAAAKQKIELLQSAANIPLSIDEVLTYAKEGIVTGELIAEILLSRTDASKYELLLPYQKGGSRSDNPYVNFYWDYFSPGKPAYVPIEYITLEAGVELLHAAGGIAVLAHPGQNLQNDYTFLDQIIKTGIDGIEAYSSYHSSSEAAMFAEIAQQRGLLITCGSDFHGKTKPAISLCEHGGAAFDPTMKKLLHHYSNFS